jgi:hypothetical protein
MSFDHAYRVLVDHERTREREVDPGIAYHSTRANKVWKRAQNEAE